MSVFGGALARFADKSSARVEEIRRAAIRNLCWAVIEDTPVKTGLL